MPKFNVVHITKYIYPSEVTDSANQIILYPKSSDLQQVISNKIYISPFAVVETFHDYFGNEVGMFTIIDPHHELEIKVDLVVETLPIPEINQTLSVEAQWNSLDSLKFEYPYVDFLQKELFTCKDEIQKVFSKLINTDMNIHDVVFALSNFIFNNFSYTQGITNIETTVDEIWKIRAGVCQDFAHLLIEMLRLLNIPARYVSGYISPSNIEMRGEGATHAWVEAYIPEIGWKGIDPTNDCWQTDRHIIIATGRDFRDCTPVKGTYKGPSDNILTVSVIITNEHTKEQTNVPINPQPSYVSMTNGRESKNISNSYQQYLEAQQQQQQ